MLSEKTKEELIRIILEQEEKIKELEGKVKEEREKRTKKFTKANVVKKRRKRWGRKKGHVGTTRSMPDHIDEVLEQELAECPTCHHSFGGSVDRLEHVQEDIIPARVHVRKYVRHRYYCPECQKVVTAPRHLQEVPQGRLGASVLVQTAILKYHHCLPYEKIAELFKEMSGLEVSPGGLSQVLARLARWLDVERSAILEAVRGSPHLHVDETGWRVDGKKNWVWAAVNDRIAYYHIDRSRARKVLKELLGKEFEGTLISDFYGVYFNLPYRMQKCLVHLLREFHDCSKRDPSEGYRKAYKKIKRIIKDSLRLREARDVLTQKVYERRVKRIKKRLFNFMTYPHENKNLKRLSKRFSKFWSDMFTFLKDPDVSWHNNLAERMIRPNVIYRNRSFGNRSGRGAETHGTIMSILQTVKLQGLNASDFLRTAFLAHRQGDPTSKLLPILSQS